MEVDRPWGFAPALFRSSRCLSPLSQIRTSINRLSLFNRGRPQFLDAAKPGPVSLPGYGWIRVMSELLRWRDAINQCYHRPTSHRRAAVRIRARSHLLAIALSAAILIAVGFTSTKVIGQTASNTPSAAAPLKTAWGAPDLQGTWSNTTVVPFQRPAQFGNREFMTEAEAQKAEDELLRRTALPGRDSRESNGEDIRRTEKDVARAYNEHWFDDKPTEVGRRTSMIVDPPDGRMPALTPGAQARIAKKREYLEALLQGTSGGKPGPISPRRNEPSPDYNLDRMNRSDGPEDRSSVERCLLNGLPVILPAGLLTPDGRPYGNFGGVMRIVESPDSVDIYYDIGQGTGFNRAIPISNRPHLPKDVRQYWGDSIARWEGDTLVVDVTNFSQETDFRGSREELHFIERSKRLDPATLQITTTAEDPTTWVKPFTFVQELRQNAHKPNMV